jgi:hypothetical protein
MSVHRTDQIEGFPLVISEIPVRMAKADLRKAEMTSHQAEIGACLDYARRDANFTLDQLAAELQRDARQVARWLRGDERTQVDVVFGVPVLRGPFVIALARLSGLEVETIVRVRRLA